MIEPVGAIREENRKIYYIGQGFLGSDLFEEEMLLYDFTARVGDTIHHSDQGSFRSIVLETDSIQIAGEYRKLYTVDNGWYYHNPDYIVEGIGSIKNGLLGHVSAIPACGTHYWEHVCYIEDGEVKYRNLYFEDCNTSHRLETIVDKDKTWYTHIHYYTTDQVNTEVIGFGEDTIISNKVYTKVLRAAGGIASPDQPYGYLREHNGQVFYRTDPDKPELMIYDFSISEHDTVNVYGMTEYGLNDCKFTCDSIRNVNIRENSRKIFYLSPVNIKGYNSETWIEGIGSMSGILHNYDGRTGGDTYVLSCVFEDDYLLYDKYETGANNCIRIALGINKASHSPVKIYPNPTEDLLIIENVDITPCRVKIFSLGGQAIHDQLIAEPVYQLDLSPFREGVYYITIRSRDFVVTRKVVRIE